MFRRGEMAPRGMIQGSYFNVNETRTRVLLLGDVYFEAEFAIEIGRIDQCESHQEDIFCYKSHRRQPSFPFISSNGERFESAVQIRDEDRDEVRCNH